MTAFMMALIHLVGILGFTYLNQPFYLLPGVVLISYQIYQYIKVGVLILSPYWELELDYDIETPLHHKMVYHISAALLIYTVWQFGYAFWAGIASLYTFTVITSMVLTWYDGDGEEEEENDK